VLEDKLMKWLLLIFLLLSISIYSQNKSNENCYYKGIQLYGRVQFVESFPDLTIEIVKYFPNLKVKIVSNFPNKCGEWQIVSSFPDIRIKIVESFGDLKIQFVENFPGMK